MSNIRILPSVLKGSATVPPSKSHAHRAVLCALLSRGLCKIHNLALSEDILATIGAAESMGARVQLERNVLILDSREGFCRNAEIDCRESGSTLRFIIPILAALGISARLTGRGRLPQRPLGLYRDCLPSHGISLRSEGGLPLELEGSLESGNFTLPGNVSSQFITGLLLAAPLLTGDSRILLSSPLESAGYVDMTLAVMKEFGIRVQPLKNGWLVPGGQRYQPCEVTIEGDWSQAAFFLAAGALGGHVEVMGLLKNSTQGDRAAETLFTRMGASLQWKGDVLTASGGELKAVDIDASQIPDLVPILAATAALADGTTTIYNAERLRMKESDRLEAMAQGLNALGVRAEQRPDGLIIHGTDRLKSGLAHGCNDHRIVMALSMAALRESGQAEITDAQSVAKSFPNFFEEYIRLGGIADVI